MSKDLSAQLIGVGIFAPKQSPRTPKVRNTKTAGITLNQSSSFSKVVEQKSNRPPIITAQSNRASIQSRLSPRNLSFGTVSCATDLYSHRQSTGVFRKTTVDYLMMHQTSKPEPLATCKAQIPSLQFMKTFEECKELSNLQDLRRHNLSSLIEKTPEVSFFQSVLTAFESINQELVYADYFTGEGKKEVIKNLFYIENLFSKVSENVGKLIDEKNQKIRVLQDAAERFEECSKILGKTSSELREIKGKTDMISKKSQEEVYYYEIRERAWNREKAQLETKVEMLCEQLENYRGLGTNEDVEKEIHKHTLVMEENINQFKKKITTLKKVISKLQLELGLAKTEISDKSTFFSEFSSIKQGLEAVIDDCKENEDELNKKLKWLKEIICMQNEDIAGYRLYRDKYMHLKTKHQSNMLKLHNLEMNIMLGNFQNSQQDGETIVSLKDPIFAPVRETIKLDPGYLRKKTKELSLISNSEHNASRSDANSPKDPFALLYKLRNEPVKKEVELNDLIYAKNNKPTYASLISIPQSNTAIYSPPFEDWLEITVRGILDSKYYEHLMCSRETGKIPSNFPEFVFSWLGSFYIDIKTRNVRELEWHRKDNANEHRLNILLGLASKPTNKVWEIFTFREFLLEDLGLDELGFYLHCRFALFGGPQLCHSSGRFSNLHYLPFDKVTSVVDLLMGNLPTANLAELKSMLRSKAKDQTSSLTIESSIVLRVMLEYYKNEKKFKLRIIKDLFDQNSRENDISQMTFESFKHLVKNIDIQIQDSKLAKLYRDSWETGSGITAESFLKAANDNGFFFAQLKLKSINPKPATDQYGIIDPNSNQYSAFLYKIEVAWKTMSKDVEMIKEVIGEMGVPDVLASLHKLEGTLNRKGSIAKEEVGNWHIGDVFRHYWALITYVQLALSECNYFSLHLGSDREAREREVIEIALGSQTFIKKVYEMNIKRVSAKIMLRKVQKKWKKKRREKQNKLVRGIFKGFGEMKLSRKVSASGLLTK